MRAAIDGCPAFQYTCGVLLRSPLLDAIPGLIHGFSTRRGGVSKPPFHSLNLSGVGDDPAALAENKARFAKATGLSVERWVQVDQVHQTRVVHAEAVKPGTEADGIVSLKPGPAPGIRTADCAPVLLAAQAPNGAILGVAAVHAGWRSATGGILKVAIAELLRAGATPSGITAAIGPAIGLDAFEVGPEVIEAAQASVGEAELPYRPAEGKKRPHLDLPGLLRLQLSQLGVLPERIDAVGGCTYAQPEIFHSYRRNGAQSGRMLSLISF